MKSKKIKIILGIVLILLLIYGGISWYFSSQLVFFTVRTYEDDKRDYKIHSIEQVGLNNPEDVVIVLNDVKISGWYFNGKRHCGVIFHHGYRGTRIRMITYTQLFKDYQCHLLLYDARHHANSTGKFGTFGYYEKFDLLKIIDWFKEKTGLEDQDIILVGESMGAAIVIQSAGYSKRKFKMILAESPYADLYTIVKERSMVIYPKPALIFLPGAFFIAELRTGANLDDVSPQKYAKDVITPIIIYHSKTDDYTPYHHSEDVYKALQLKEKELILTDWGSKHAYSIDDNYQKYHEYFINFMKKYNITF
ncbi:MAG: exported protein [Leptospiraceae bacterium]|nr:MAG: exported protein [Leptospiraceae bacterium]